jgi:hypothetical protein
MLASSAHGDDLQERAGEVMKTMTTHGIIVQKVGGWRWWVEECSIRSAHFVPLSTLMVNQVEW